VVLQMISVGEEAGELDELLREVAEMYQREVEYELKTLSSQIEPILIVMLGAWCWCSHWGSPPDVGYGTGGAWER